MKKRLQKNYVRLLTTTRTTVAVFVRVRLGYLFERQLN
jgi:hypothetical protein